MMFLYISFAYFTYAFPEWKRGKKDLERAAMVLEKDKAY
jgi:hypothetical protein